MDKITQDMKYRYSLVKYAQTEGVSKASRKYNRALSIPTMPQSQSPRKAQIEQDHCLRNRANYSLILDIQGLKLYP
jgi:hypothetical protein